MIKHGEGEDSSKAHTKSMETTSFTMALCNEFHALCNHCCIKIGN